MRQGDWVLTGCMSTSMTILLFSSFANMLTHSFHTMDLTAKREANPPGNKNGLVVVQGDSHASIPSRATLLRESASIHAPHPRWARHVASPHPSGALRNQRRGGSTVPRHRHGIELRIEPSASFLRGHVQLPLQVEHNLHPKPRESLRGR
jgi:hypothetical protein